MSCVYSITSKDLQIKDSYVGSCKDFKIRQCRHKSDTNNINGKAYNRKLYKFIRDNGGWDNFNMSLLEECSLENLKIKEQEYIKKLNSTLNTINAKTDKLEYNRELYYKNTEIRKEQHKKWVYKNKQKNKEYMDNYRKKNKVNVICPHCNGSMLKSSLSTHIKKYHN
tara:strand:- start:49 stop:549 length:501 start_codon:yes stop_codon:yes gene_type:complete